MIIIRLTKNPETARLLILLAACLLFFTALAVGINFALMRHYERTIIRNHAAMVGAVVKKYPEAEHDLIRQLLQADAAAAREGEALLSRYGIETGALLADLEALQSSYRTGMALSAGFAVLVSGTFTFVFYLFLKKRYGEIRAISGYARRIKNGDYSLDIRDNNEGEISLLKNEIYKITTMLKEQAGTLRRERAALADSIADISHQLKTPLTSLLMLNELLHDDPAPAVRREFLDRTRAQLQRVEWLVNALLKLARLDAGTVTMKQDQITVAALLDHVLAAVSVPLDIKRQQAAGDGTAGAAFRGDFNWSAEALINILRNCIEYTPEEGVIRITFAENPLYTEIRIADSGPGIDRKDLPHIFKRFYKGKNSPEDTVGIGLAMARAIVRKQGGDITVQSEQGKGTEFTIKFYKTPV